MATVHRSRLNDIPLPDNAIEMVSVRLNTDRILKSDTPIKNSEDAVGMLRSEMQDFDREHFVVLNLDNKLRVINAHIASIGSIGSAIVEPREVFKAAILSNASAVLVLHNHPSGEAFPSQQDVDVTRRLISAGRLMGVSVLDHIVVGKDDFYSFKGSGRLDVIDEIEELSDRVADLEREASSYNAENRKLSFREKVAQTFIKSLEESPRGWVRKWQTNETGKAYNMASGREYRGANAFFLKFIEKTEGYMDPRWMTFRQAIDAGYKIPKGTKATPVEYFFMYDRLERKSVPWSEYNALSDFEKNQRFNIKSGEIVTAYETGDYIVERYQLRAKEHYVFNAAQLSGVPEYVIDRVQNDISPSEVVDAVSSGMGVEIVEEEQGRAFYSPLDDKITMPLKTQFYSDYDYQSTALHELGHATGASSRLNRDIENWFGTPEYAYEELIAEITSSFMGEYLDAPLSDADMDNHIAYVQSWIGAIEKDPNYLFRAIKEAKKHPIS